MKTKLFAMPDTNDAIYNLINKYLKGPLLPAEQDELNRWIGASPGNKAIFEQLTSEQWVSAQLNSMYQYDETAGWEKVSAQLSESKEGPFQQPAKSIVRTLWQRAAVAACILFVLSAGGYFLLRDGLHNGKGINDQQAVKDDIKAPATNRAMITLADQSVIYLDSSGNGQLATQGNATIVKLDNGRIAYEAGDGDIPGAIKYNTLTNPRGSQVIDMKLADGSHVWLNAGSSVTFPVAFAGRERKVSITGEAYFEVAHDAAKPFMVDINGKGVVEVLGTHFNINAYHDEQSSKVTLLEGAVKIIRGADSRLLKPGQQAQVTEQVKVVDDADLEEVMAWKNGKFVFNRTDIQSTMRQVARWYNVEIAYQGNVEGYFNGTISRSENISTILKKLQLTEEVHFEIDGKKILVKP